MDEIDDIERFTVSNGSEGDIPTDDELDDDGRQYILFLFYTNS